MQALVHFAAGISAALLVLTYVDWPQPREFACTFASGLWALVPDFHWIFRELSLGGVARLWQAFHRSVFANVFWFHRAIDLVDGTPRDVEVGIALSILVPPVLAYYRYNEWTHD